MDKSLTVVQTLKLDLSRNVCSLKPTICVLIMVVIFVNISYILYLTLMTTEHMVRKLKTDNTI